MVMEEIEHAEIEAETQLSRLQAAYDLKQKYRVSVLDEMRAKGEQGILWSNGRCADWANYAESSEALDKVIDEVLGPKTA